MIKPPIEIIDPKQLNAARNVHSWIDWLSHNHQWHGLQLTSHQLRACNGKRPG